VKGFGITARVAELCIAEFSDLCAVYLRNGGPLPVVFASRDPEKYASLSETPRDDNYAEVLRAAGLPTLVEEPLLIAGRVAGTLVLATGTGRRFTQANRRSISLLCAILCDAMEQMEQLSLHDRVSKRLQQALLPASLTRVDGLRLDAAYLPATSEADVGGDWYDTFDVGNGTIGISVGDVVGHGLEAAVAMSEVRSAIRATAGTTASPSAILRSIDELMSAQGIGMATAIVGFYDPDSGLLRYASAGHPMPALLQPSGRALLLPAGGLMLGLGLSKEAEDMTITVARGATVFFYTDGLLEYGRDILAGERALLDALQRLDADDHRYAEALHEMLFDGSVENADDCATLAIHRVPDETCSSESFTYSSIPACAALAREALRNFSERFVSEQERNDDLVTAVGEAVANAIEHGASRAGSVFDIEARLHDESLVVEVRNPGHWRPFTPRFDGGRGLQIMRVCASNLEISSAQEETRVRMTFRQ
jgi:anti-sigma regulatory factor (Ser/Thr protein kinase)